MGDGTFHLLAGTGWEAERADGRRGMRMGKEERGKGGRSGVCVREEKCVSERRVSKKEVSEEGRKFAISG